jgi:hypothetical protein
MRRIARTHRYNLLLCTLFLSLRHGFNKKFSRTTQQLRQAVGGSNVTVDILFEALLEKFNLQQAIAHKFVKYILAWLVSIKGKRISMFVSPWASHLYCPRVSFFFLLADMSWDDL